jgi:hypothetical protein
MLDSGVDLGRRDVRGDRSGRMPFPGYSDGGGALMLDAG